MRISLLKQRITIKDALREPIKNGIRSYFLYEGTPLSLSHAVAVDIAPCILD
ncbi:hypothetical protein H8K32_05475 [Undibacterium jejuense]|uniref:Uncharacterized protein n=1 Tax=Undibacterium jejuense TaxID=1344949 RepID=A0A923HGB8_9BURK|nr:hypothetical protein [Undibacterium jejuense]MBC3861545.1 hypothetical protein [Undibacterium jejuense]